VPGLGPARRNALLRHFGSLRKIRQADVAEIAAVPGMGPRTAVAVLSALSGPGAADAAEHPVPPAQAMGDTAAERAAPPGAVVQSGPAVDREEL
jgi:excinuclease ABC subunit C